MAQSTTRGLSLLLLIILSLCHLTTASFSHGSAMRFSEWFPNSASDFADISIGVCNASLKAFEDAYNDSPSIPLVNLGITNHWPVFDLCRAHASCILENVSEMSKASLATAGVVLGLLPTLLAVLSPSISELVLLSSQRPLLASILSVGAPGVLQRRIFEYEDPFELIEPPESAKVTTRSLMILGPWTGWKSNTVALLQFLLAMACGVNTVSLAIQTSNRSIISWGCTRTWPLIVWAFVPTVIHWIGAIGYRLTLDKSCAIPISRGSSSGRKPNTPTSSTADSEADRIEPKVAHVSSTCVASDSEHTRRKQSFPQQVQAWMTREGTSCASHSSSLALRHPLETSSPRANFGILLNCVASFLSFFHILYGTVVFSALLFISNLDAIGQVVLRGLASAILCRFLVLIEMAGMRGALMAANKQE